MREHMGLVFRIDREIVIKMTSDSILEWAKDLYRYFSQRRQTNGHPACATASISVAVRQMQTKNHSDITLHTHKTAITKRQKTSVDEDVEKLNMI